MNIKFKKHLLIFQATSVLLFLFSALIYSQTPPYEKHEFTYKVVKQHEIKANIFVCDTVARHPVVIYFHGGGFIFGNRDQGLPDILKDDLLANNYSVISADYRLAPETKLAEILNDVRDMVLWVKTNGEKQFSIDPEKIAVIGGSAGGYLSLSTGFTVTPAPQAVIAISTPTDYSNVPPQGDLEILKQPGPYDIVTDKPVSYGDYSSRMQLYRFLGKNRLALFEIFGFDVSQNENRLKKFMLTEQITSQYPPTLLVHARNDHLVPVKLAEQFHDFLLKKKVQSELYLTEFGHSTKLIKNNPNARQNIIKFLDKHLK